MICPYCGEGRDKVIDSRAAEGGEAIRRRRECEGCKRRFTTYERVEKARRLSVVKRDGSRVPFDGQKILAGIHAACGKRPIPETVRLQIVAEIDEYVHREHEREVTSAEIGGLVAQRLREIDPVAYVRFASEYYAFETAKDFEEELKRLDSRPPMPRGLPMLFDE